MEDEEIIIENSSDSSSGGIFETFYNVCEWLYDSIVSALLYIWELIGDFAFSITKGLFDFLPDFDLLSFLDDTTIELINEQLFIFNCFLPVEESFEAVSYFITSVLGYIVIKLIIKFIPTIG